MLMTAEKRDVHLVGGAAETRRKFTFKVTGEMFRSQIAGIYSDRIKAPVREYATNAYDAHIRANKAHVPFDVVLPTQLEPVFKIRDYGLGLSEENVLFKYTCIGETDKNTSNNEVGGLGLGCKSGFAYTSQFTVTSWHDGIKTVFSMFLGYDGIPEVQKIFDGPSDEPTGIEILIPVKREDITAFEVAANSVFFGFDPVPNLKNASVKFNFPKVEVSGPNWRVIDDGNGPRARQGCVIYPLNRIAIGGYGDVWDLSIIIDFPIGALSIATNREALGNDQRTKTAVLKKMTEVSKSISYHLQQKIDTCQTYIDACKMAHKAHDPCSAVRRPWYRFGHSLKYNKKDLVSHLSLSKDEYCSVTTVTNKSMTSDFPVPSWNPKSMSVSMSNWDKTLFILDDAPNFSISRLRAAILENRDDYDFMYWVRDPKNQWNALLKFFHDPAWIKLSDYEPYKAPKGQRAPRATVKMPTTYIQNGYICSAVALDISQTGIYIEKVGNSTYLYGKNELDSDRVRRLMNRLIEAKVIDSSNMVYCFTEVKHAKVKQMQNWTKLEDHVKTRLQDLVSKTSVMKQETFRQISNDRLMSFLQNQDKFKYPKEIISLIVDFKKEKSTTSVTPSALLELYEEQFPGEIKNLTTGAHPLFTRLNDVKKRWPLFSVLSNTVSYWQNFGAEDTKILNDYLASN